MKTPKTLLTNLMKTTLLAICLANFDGFHHRFGFFFFAKCHVQNSVFVNSGNRVEVHGFREFEGAFERSHRKFAAGVALGCLFGFNFVFCFNGQEVVFDV